MARRAAKAALRGLALALACAGFSAATYGPPATIDYAAVERYLDKGAMFVADRFDPERCGYAIDTVNPAKDYCFARLDAAFEKLTGVDRRSTLASLFIAITDGATTETDRHRRVLYFLQRSLFHNRYWMPLHRDGTMVTDPLVLLELGEAHCGQVARLAVDLFEAAGYAGRVVQLGGHVVAEIFYEGDWHYLDADLYGGGDVILVDGRIPSVAELSRRPELVDTQPTNHAFSIDGEPWRAGSIYPSYFYFSRRAYSGYDPQVYVKTATPEQARDSTIYGWNYYETRPYPIELRDAAPLREPNAPIVKSVANDGNDIAIDWWPSENATGYRVYVSSASRGWRHERALTSVPRWVSIRTHWSPAMYDALYDEPPGDIAVIHTESNVIRIPLDRDRIFVTVMAIDEYGEGIGRTLYPMSQEVVIGPRPAVQRITRPKTAAATRPGLMRLIAAE